MTVRNAMHERWRPMLVAAVMTAGVVCVASPIVGAETDTGGDPAAASADGEPTTNDGVAAPDGGTETGGDPAAASADGEPTTNDGGTAPAGGTETGGDPAAASADGEPTTNDGGAAPAGGTETGGEAPHQEAPGQEPSGGQPPTGAPAAGDAGPKDSEPSGLPDGQTGPIESGAAGAPGELDSPADAAGTEGVGTTESGTTKPSGTSQPKPASTAVQAQDSPNSAGESAHGTPAGAPAASGPDEGPPAPSSLTAEQDAEVEQTQVAISNTGRNLAVGNGTAVITEGPLTISTGAATAVGNDEQTEITQEAVTALSGQANAEIIQISIVFNIGGGFASTGSNAATSGGAGGASSTQTGSAYAVGNDSETYLTQAGTANATSGHDESIDQRVLTLQLGVAVSDTGNNIIVATVTNGSGGPATIVSGGALAVGNQSDTSIEQIARVVGSGHAELSIEQWATVLNLGVALANTGANQVGDMFAALLANPDSDDISELFEILLPALLADPHASTDEHTADAIAAAAGDGAPAAGDISTGEAVAIGNRSLTEVQQVAVAIASGTGRAEIRQEVVAVNAGAATANSGGNRTGAAVAGAPPPLDPAVQNVVDQLSSHVAAVLKQISAWGNGAVADLAPTSLSARIGEYLVGLDGFFSTSVETRDTEGGLIATIRQLSAVFNLGVALADTGHNVMLDVTGSAASTEHLDPSAAGTLEGAPEGPAAIAAADAFSEPRAAGALSATQVQNAIEIIGEIFTIVTGDASARNSALIVVCQRVNSPDHDCLRPPDPPIDEDDVVVVPVAQPPVQVDPPAATPEAEPAATPEAEPAARVQAITPSAQGPPASEGSLPRTGAGSGLIIVVGLLLLLLGAGFTAVARRRSV